tara:strand:+ start:389 stop:562 length:174 start_codon:yes stop_codon:yes gene_type:complete
MDKKYNKMKRSYVYEYENTPKRRLLNGLENFINWALLLTATMTVFGGIAIAIINLIQ